MWSEVLILALPSQGERGQDGPIGPKGEKGDKVNKIILTSRCVFDRVTVVIESHSRPPCGIRCNRVIRMQTMWTYFLLLQGEVGQRGLPGAPGNASQISAVSILHVNLLRSHSQAMCDSATTVEMESVILFDPAFSADVVNYVSFFTGGKCHPWARWTGE